MRKYCIFLGFVLIFCLCYSLGSADNIGIWEKSFLLDKFDDPTDCPYVTFREKIQGKYNNAYVEDGKLHERLLA